MQTSANQCILSLSILSMNVKLYMLCSLPNYSLSYDRTLYCFKSIMVIVMRHYIAGTKKIVERINLLLYNIEYVNNSIRSIVVDFM